MFCNFIFDDLYIVKKDACPCGALIGEGERLRNRGKWMRQLFLILFFFFLYLGKGGREGERATPSILTTSVPRYGEWPLSVIPESPSVEHAPRVLILKWFQ